MLAGIAAVAPLIGGVIDLVRKAVTNKDEALQIEAKLRELEMIISYQRDEDQLRVNEVEAGSDSIFVAGWRPFIGWASGVSFVWHVLLAPMIIFIARLTGHDVPMPEFDAALLTQVLFSMLGFGYMGALRTNEKKQIEANKQEIRKTIANNAAKKAGLDATFNGK